MGAPEVKTGTVKVTLQIDGKRYISGPVDIRLVEDRKMVDDQNAPTNYELSTLQGELIVSDFSYTFETRLEGWIRHTSGPHFSYVKPEIG